MNNGLLVLALLLTAVTATAAALTRDPVRQAAVLALLGLCLALLFTVLQAPDVALSQLGVGSAITPLLILLTVRRVRREEHSDELAAGSGARADRPDRAE
ncbi:Na(+)/H(+) antiporter subunit B [Kitasatospora sp. NPDC101155]|uniref:Na(+)/H(+) antiporter subunit B n=1 Tax=Kitasatospora sp. NPDC101155 TaxID=3364097 RepID=UPI003806759D